MLVQRIREKFQNMTLRIQAVEVALDCLLNSPVYVDSEMTGFNGQIFRKKIFVELVETFIFETMIETGTHTGNTTGYMAKLASQPVYTCELNHIYFSIAKKRLAAIPDIHFILGDSRKFLNELVENEVHHRNSFIYLDAHWHSDLPLEKEIEIICNHWNDFVIMVDDFQVPHDEGYGYDNYGRHKILSLKNFSKVIKKYNLTPFFPILPSSEETGYKRGCVILAPPGRISEKIQNIKALTRFAM